METDVNVKIIDISNIKKKSCWKTPMSLLLCCQAQDNKLLHTYTQA